MLLHMRSTYKLIRIEVIVIILSSTLSIAITQPAVATAPPNPIKLPIGTWIVSAGGQAAVLNISSIDADNNIKGTFFACAMGTWCPATHFSKIFGFWDSAAWKITFLKENEVFNMDNPKDPKYKCSEIGCHGRDQLFTGYMFGGLPCDPTATDPQTNKPLTGGCTSGGAAISTKGSLTIAGSYEAFGDTVGTGAVADRNVFGWVAVHNGTIEQEPCKCPNQNNTAQS